MKTLSALFPLLLISCLTSCIYVDSDGTGSHFDDVEVGECGPSCAVCDDECVLLNPVGSECASDSDCFDSDVCLGGECIFCPQTCESGDCGDDSELCSTDGICIPDDRCRSNNDCQDSQICSQNGYCVEPQVEPKDPADCEEDECLTLACHDNSECQAGATCTNGKCLAGCVQDADCSNAQICDAGSCQENPDGGSQCLYNSECDNGVCENGYCFDRCDDDSTCGCIADQDASPECILSSDCNASDCIDGQCK